MEFMLLLRSYIKTNYGPEWVNELKLSDSNTFSKKKLLFLLNNFDEFLILCRDLIVSGRLLKHYNSKKKHKKPYKFM
jgi:hypothetical protein